MTVDTHWFTCPKCKTYKLATRMDAKVICCDFCGRYFDLLGNEKSPSDVSNKDEKQDKDDVFFTRPNP